MIDSKELNKSKYKYIKDNKNLLSIALIIKNKYRMGIKYDPEFPIDKYNKHELLVEGIKTKEDKKRYLVKHLYENEDSFNIRVERTAYRNFASPIISAYTSAVFAEQPVRNLPDRLSIYIDDVDLNGNDADNFFNNVAYQTAKHGIHFVFVALPKTEDIKTLDQAKEAGHRPYFVSLDTRNIVRVNMDEQNPYVVIRNIMRSAPTPFDEYETTDEYSIWYNDKWEKYITDDDGNLIKIDEGTNHLGFIPLIPFYFKKKKDYVGISAINDVDELLINLFRKDSELDKALFDCAIPLLFLKGMETDEANGLIKSTDNAFVTNSENGDGKYIEPNGVSFEFLFKSIDKLEDSIREIALRAFKTTFQNLQSAESKAIDKKDFDNIVSSFAKNIEDGEELCWYIFDIANNGSGDDDININYTTAYDLKDISEALLAEMKDLAKNRLISKESLYEFLKTSKILPDNFDSVDELNRLKNESYNTSLPSLNI